MTPSPETPSKFIKIVNHPHSGLSDPTIIPIEETSGDSDSQVIPIPLCPTEGKPWAPFHSCADFEYTETAVLSFLSKDLVNKQLHGINHSWLSHSAITFCSHADMVWSLEAVREYSVPVSI